MHLKKVTLTNFRCFEKLEVNLHPRLTVFVAENGGGKTAVLDGIAIGLAPLLQAFSSADQRLSGPGIKDTDYLLKRREGRARGEHWDTRDYAQVVVETTNGLEWDNWRPSRQGKTPAQKIGQSGLKHFASAVTDSLQTDTPKLIPVVAYYGARRGWIEIPERLRESTIDYGHPTSALVGALDSLSDFKEMLKWFDSVEASELRANRGRSGEEYAVDTRLQSVRSTVSFLLGHAFRNPRFNLKHKFVVTSENGIAELQVSQLSQGYQSMLALGMDFARRLALANSHLAALSGVDNASMWDEIIKYVTTWTPEYGETSSDPALARTRERFLFSQVLWPFSAPAVMLIDEIDLHLHPSWQQRVLGDLMGAFPGTQFIVSTHSPQVLSTVPKECIRKIQFGDGQCSLETPEYQTRGVESADVLGSIMGVNPVPKVEEARLLNDYRALIDTGDNGTEIGTRLRQRLVAHFGETHPVILDCDRLIRFQGLRRRFFENEKGSTPHAQT